MLIKEYRIVNPYTQSEYQIGQLYATAMASKEQTGGGEGVEVLKNEPYEKENGEKGQYTYKVFHLASKVPSYVRAVIPASALEIYEEAWNAYPYCKTVLTNGYMKESFSITYETLHVDGSRGELDNALNISSQDLAKREVIHIDIANDPIDTSEYKPEEDPKYIHSFKAERGPLVGDWIKNCEPVMTCYKLVYIEFKWFGLQTRVESYLAGAIRGMFTKFHRQLFSWLDKWYGMKMEDIRELEKQIKAELDIRRNAGLDGTSVSSKSGNLSSSKQSSSSYLSTKE
ncbi:uncharacterized protein BX664DRAFT_380560 [Halteromyces radiatus]|uniref:uncharacterized protein n=1 Tax=Halteromyces radiatus TaxID=101107 RepID=UPI00221FE2C6|nr:uncharacterized protein BX664DRAFT_380560 [Halteromyces radiatus]KAI8081416.1 hypothetical protein BX664DRAFT_380560 [Halteromyces radiatus]